MGSKPQDATPKVVRLPRLPGVPRPPRFPLDPRQQTFRQIVGGFARELQGRGALAVANTTEGFPASSVDVGKLKGVLERGLKAFDMRHVKDRWTDDVFDWMRLTIRSWAQRCKLMQLKPRRAGIRIRLQTQDDFGYYDYAFDVFAGRERVKPKPKGA